MATPHVSGLAALYLGSNPTATVTGVTAAIRDGGLNGVITNAQSANGNILINNNFIKASVPPAPPAPVNPPTAVTATAITSTSATISWTPPAVVAGVASTAPQSYLVEYKLATDTTWLSTSTTGTSVALSGLASLSNYVVRVTSVAGSQNSAPTAELQFATLGTAPDAPTALTSTAIYGNQIDLAWTAPNSNGAVINGYYLEQSIAGGAWSRIATTGLKTYSVTRLTPSTNYSFRVQAYNTFGAGAYSTVFNVATSNSRVIE
jgi:predicted phage tail protein